MLLPGPVLLTSPARAGWTGRLSHPVPFRRPVDAVPDAYVGSCTTARMRYGALIATGLATLAVTAGTRVFRTAEA